LIGLLRKRRTLHSSIGHLNKREVIRLLMEEDDKDENENENADRDAGNG
jgi:hypothetical protein